uniref:Uncharacterized protein n=1 Tax=Rhizophora mucronata TaxID=61149 RepID=A0A2P2NZL9_RHIMU
MHLGNRYSKMWGRLLINHLCRGTKIPEDGPLFMQSNELLEGSYLFPFLFRREAHGMGMRGT